MSRREFLRLAAGTAMAAPFLGLPTVAASTNAGRRQVITTLARTLQRGQVVGTGTRGSYYRLAYGPGEPYVRRLDLAPGAPARGTKTTTVLHFAHFTDIHIVDPESPARVEFLDRNADGSCTSVPFQAAQRPQEILSARALEITVETLNALGRSPVTGRPIRFAMCTGDNIDNEQLNELRLFLSIMDGGPVNPNSGGPGYEGVQAASWADPDYWHAEEVPDRYATRYGFPRYPGLFDQALDPFTAQGFAFPWFACNGNHDGLMQGNAPQNPAFEAVALGNLKVTGPPPGVNPCDQFELFRSNPGAVLTGQSRPVTADANRQIITRRELVEEHFHTRGQPVGHGFTARNRLDGTAYYVNDDFRHVRMIVLDTTNPGGLDAGSIGEVQLGWLEEQLIASSSTYLDGEGHEVRTGNADRLIVLFSHHGLRSMDNENQAPDPTTPGSNDLPRHLADEVEALIHRFPNVVLWVNGHTHDNRVVARPDPDGRTNGFWDVTTSSLCDWPSQTRLIEVVDNRNGTISIWCTMVDHAAPADPTGTTGLDRLTSIHRELASNDYQRGFDDGASGAPTDRNVELVIPAPFRIG